MQFYHLSQPCMLMVQSPCGPTHFAAAGHPGPRRHSRALPVLEVAAVENVAIAQLEVARFELESKAREG